MSESKRYTGTVKWFNPHKGFGFITPDPNNNSSAPPDDLFVHYTSILSDGFRTLYEGQPVEFYLEFSREDTRSKAVDVSVLNRSHGGSRGGRGWYPGRGGGRDGGGGRRGGYGGGMGGGSGGVECYNCGRVGHLARDCYQGQGGGGGRGGGRGRGGRRYGGGGGGGGGGRGEGGGGQDYGGGGQDYGGGDGYGGGGDGYGGGRGGGRRGCFNCGEEGHLARDCPNYGDN